MDSKRPLPDWDNLSFRLTETDSVYRCAGVTGNDPVWEEGQWHDWDNFPLSPAAGVLSYGIGVFEGIKAERALDGRILLFRADASARRFGDSARILRMEPFPEERYVDICIEAVRRNERFIPPAGKGQLYLRPVQYASEPMLGLRRADRFDVIVYASPVGAYFNDSGTGVSLKVLDEARVAPGGVGAAKTCANYPGGIAKREAWQAKGFNDVLFLDARGAGHISETSGSNVFAVLEDGRLITPPLDDQILPGITRDSVLELARQEFRWQVEERPVGINEVLDGAVELFCTGTAWTVRSVASLDYQGRKKEFKGREACSALFKRLRGIQTGAQPDPYEWTRSC